MAMIKNSNINLAIPSSQISQEEFMNLIKDAEKGTFKPIGTFEEFRKNIISVWKKRHVK